MGSKKKSNNKIKKKDNSNSNLKNSDVPSISGPSNGKKNASVINDPRFSSMHTDPRFREGAPKHKTKVAIDSRFDRMFTDKSFRPSSAPVDKRGRPNKGPTTNHASLRHYYKEENKEEETEEVNEEISEEEEEVVVKGNRVKAVDEESSELESESGKSESAESEGSVSESDTDEGADVDDYDDDEVPEVKEEVPQIEKETHRLAVVNMDWRYVKAADLYVLLSSFVPSNGMIKSVAVYPSEFGLQRMKEEEVRGPVGLFDDEKENGDEDSGGDDDIDNEKLREYEKSRMRYYFAVVECDSSTTADYIYKECDGLEFIQSSNALDLRFIPDDMEFKHPPRDVATEAPANYECKDFYSRALQHSKVNLSWDDDEPIRAKTLKRKFNDEQLAQLELKEFLTSDASESDDDEEEDTNNEEEDKLDKKAKKREKYRALLKAGDGSEGDSEDDGVQDMEVTFNTGLEDISKHIMEKKDKKSETVWEAYLRKRREKKKARKNKSKYSSDDDSSDDTDQEAAEEADDFFIEEPTVKKRKKAQSKNDEEKNNQDRDGVEATKEELELLLADDNGTDAGLKGYNLKLKKVKGKKDEAIDESKIPSSAYEDPRFAALFSPDYVIDPTDPQFKRSAAYARQLAQKRKKGDSELSAEREHVNHPRGAQLSSDDPGMMIKKGGEEGSNALRTKKDKHDLSSLVKSIKMKSKQVQLPSEGKTRKDRKSQRGASY